MYRTAAKRLAGKKFWSTRLAPGNSYLRAITISDRYCTSTTSQSFTNQNPNSANLKSNSNSFESESVNRADPTLSSATAADEARGFDGRSSGGGRRVKTEYKEEQARVLKAALSHVNRLGWSEAAMMAGARGVGVSPAIIGSFPRKEAALVEHFMDECLQNLIDIIDSDEDLKKLIPSERISKLVKIRLEMQAPYISTWAQALSIQALPVNVPTSFKQRAMLVDEIWHAAGDDSSDTDWYVKRTVLGGIYSATELYMLTDNSPDFRDTWKFLDARVRDAFDLKKTVQEARYLAEAVSAGMGGSLQGLMQRVLQR